MKIVINRCFGGYSLSEQAYQYLGIPWNGYGFAFDEESTITAGYLDRNDPRLVDCVEALGEKANGRYAKLKVVEVPDDVQWYISDYDGLEEVHEVHRVWK